jgi:hypothetical protein
MGTKRFNDGVIDLSSLRNRKEEEKKAEVEYNPDAILNTIPAEFEATNDEGAQVTINVLSVAVMPDRIYLILTDNKEGEPPFLMLGKHENNVFTQDLIPATEQDLEEYNAMVAEHRASKQAEELEAQRQQQLQEMLDKAESEEEREQIRQMFENQQ